jgi:hypothetical protein
VIFIALSALACSTLLGESEPPEFSTDADAPAAEATSEADADDTPVEAPTSEPSDSPVDEPTSEPSDDPVDEPTSESDDTADLPAGFTTHTSVEEGISVSYPSDWFIDDFFGFISISSQEEFLEDAESPIDGAAVLVAVGDAAEFGETEPAAMLTTAIADIEIGEEVTVIEGPNITEINGQEAAVARVTGVDDFDVPFVADVAVAVNGDRSGLVLAAAPSDSFADFEATFEVIINSLEVGEPEIVEDFVDPGEVVPIAGTIAPGETLEATVPDDGTLAYQFESTAGGPVAILVEPEEDLDVQLEIRRATELIFLPDPGESYIIQVAPFGVFGGEVEVTVLDRDTAVVLEGTVGGDENNNHRVCVPSGQSLIAIVDPDEALDATLELRGAGGGLLSDDVVDNGFSGGSEILVFEEGATFQEDYPVIVSVGAYSDPGGEYTLILKASDGLVVPDGC